MKPRTANSMNIQIFGTKNAMTQRKLSDFSRSVG